MNEKEAGVGPFFKKKYNDSMFKRLARGYQKRTKMETTEAATYEAWKIFLRSLMRVNRERETDI